VPQDAKGILERPKFIMGLVPQDGTDVFGRPKLDYGL